MATLKKNADAGGQNGAAGGQQEPQRFCVAKRETFFVPIRRLFSRSALRCDTTIVVCDALTRKNFPFQFTTETITPADVVCAIVEKVCRDIGGYIAPPVDAKISATIIRKNGKITIQGGKDDDPETLLDVWDGANLTLPVLNDFITICSVEKNKEKGR